MWTFYHIGIVMYVSAIKMAALFSDKARRWVEGRKDLFTRMAEKLPGDKPSIWMHCASLGEFEMGRPVLEALRKDYPGHLLVLTFFSPSGYEIRKNYQGVDLVVYLPPDLPGHVRRFLALTRPVLALFVKYEFWFGYLRELNRRQIPVMLISGRFRPGQHFFRWYGGWFYRQLHAFSRLHLQDQESAMLAGQPLQAKVTVSGDTRYDRVSANAATHRDLPEIKVWLNGRKCMIAGSTWPADDQLMLPWNDPEMALIIAPHEVHPQRIRQLQQMAGAAATLYSDLPKNNTGNILIIDNIGMLLSVYALGELAYVGGGFGSGLHNILEPAAFGLPVIFGPDHKKFPEAAALIKAGAAGSVSTRSDFEAAVKGFCDPDRMERARESARNFVLQRKGATMKIMQSVHELIS